MKYRDLFIVSTDTVLGLGAPISEKNKDLIYEIKQRDLSKKLIIVLHSFDQLLDFPGWDQDKIEVAKKYWPGEITFVIDNQGYRIPGNKQLLQLLEKNGPCYLTSANISGQDPLTFEESKVVFKDVGNHYDFGNGSGTPSTIVDLDNNKILRQGKIKYIG